ncbi:MAG: hypothetical protein WBD32_16260 [Acidobacteriaceae bacterium]
MFSKSLDGTKAALEAVLAVIAYDLGEQLLPWVQRVVAEGIDPKALTAQSFGEEFSSAISDFVNGDIDYLMGYRKLSLAKRGWTKWAKRLSWFLLLAIGWQIVCTGAIYIWSNILGHPITDRALLSSIAPSVVAVLGCLTCIVLMLYYHDQICDYRQDVL